MPDFRQKLKNTMSMKTYYTNYDTETEMFQLVNIKDYSDVIPFQEDEFLDNEFVSESEIEIKDGFAVHREKKYEVINVGDGVKLYNLENGTTVVDKSYGRLDEILEFAEKMKLKNHFIGVLESLCQNQPDKVAFVYADFTYMGLVFGKYKNNMVWPIHEANVTPIISNGGIIYHGPHDNGGDGGAPTFTVSINPSRKPHWSIHT
jgi:hypothetical protein